MKDDCKVCLHSGNGTYGGEPDPCWGVLSVVSACCGHGDVPQTVLVRGENGVSFLCEVIQVRCSGDYGWETVNKAGGGDALSCAVSV